MKIVLQAACGCHTGKVRKNNEDNFYFDGVCLEQENSGQVKPLCYEHPLRKKQHFAVFDGMGGENFGEMASFAAARQLKRTERKLVHLFAPKEEYLEKLTQQLNAAVVDAQKEMCTERMGTTMVSLCFSGDVVYVCNVGDSRAYRLRDGALEQLSVDHVEKRPGRENKKAPLTQHLGFGDEEIQIEPYVAKEQIKQGDLYLLCSDGLTDMLTNLEISDIMLNCTDAESCVEALIQSALEHGGRDNITVIVCRLI